MTAFHSILGAFFSNQSTSSTIFAQISPNLHDKELKKYDPKKRNVCTLISGAIFVKSKHIKRFCEGFYTFWPNFHRFCANFKGFFPDFHQIKIFVGELTLLSLNLLLKTFTQLVWMPEKAVLPQTHLIHFA